MSDTQNLLCAVSNEARTLYGGLRYDASLRRDHTRPINIADKGVQGRLGPAAQALFGQPGSISGLVAELVEAELISVIGWTGRGKPPELNGGAYRVRVF